MPRTRTTAPGGGGHRVFAALYDRLGAAAERGYLGDQRRALLSVATGTTLEIGAGTGANLRHLPASVTSAVLTEPDPAMRRRLTARLWETRRPGTRVDPSPAEDLDVDDGRIDTVICTLALGSVADPAAALAEVRRVLRPGGRFLFLEHVRGDGRRARAQDRVAPFWHRCAAGCHPNRDSVATIRDAGFRIEALRLTDDGPGLRLATPYAIGRAVAPPAPGPSSPERTGVGRPSASSATIVKTPVVQSSRVCPAGSSRWASTTTFMLVRPTDATRATNSTSSPSRIATRNSSRSTAAVTTATDPARRTPATAAAESIHAISVPP